MFKKILTWCLLILFILPLPAMASFSDEVKAFEAKYPEIYGTIDPALAAKMETYLEDVVNYVVVNYDDSKSIDTQIMNAVPSVLLTGETYKNDLMPFLLEQAVNQDTYRTQLTEMQEIVRIEALARIAAQNSSSGGGGGTTTDTDSAITIEVKKQLAAGNERVILNIEDSTQSVTLTAATLKSIADAGKDLEMKIGGVTFRLPPQSLNLTTGSTLAISARTLSTTQIVAAEQKLSNMQTIVGSVYELNNGTATSPQGVQFQKPVTIVLSYAGATVPSNGNVLDVYCLNETIGQWEAMNGIVDNTNQTISFTTTHFSKYAILSSPPAAVNKFIDLPTAHWACADVEKLVGMGLVKGISATEFAPERNITRAEFAALLVRALDIKTGTQLTGKFADVAATEWYFSVVNAAAEAGLVSGYSAVTFGPNDPVTREQIAVMISRALTYNENNTTDTSGNTNLQIFEDKQQISSWALDGVSTAVHQGIIKGRSTTQFAPLEKATRAEAAVMILRMYNL